MTYPQQPSDTKKSGPVIAGVAAGVTVLGLGITGFLAPGFLVSEQSPTTTSTPTSVATTKPGDTDPRDFLESLASGLDSRDATVLMGLTCHLKRPAVDSVIDNVAAVSEATLLDTRKITARRATGIVSVTTDARRTKIEVTVTRDDGTWCWSDARPAERTRPISSRPTPTTSPDSPTAGGKPVEPEALAAMRAFLDSVNSGDAATAKTLLCSDGIATPQKVDDLIGLRPNLRIDTGMDGISSGKESVQLYLSGTAKGQRLAGHDATLWATSHNGPWCIHAFRAVVV